MENDDICSVTTQILNQPSQVESHKFIKAYNAIFKECTNEEPRYQIKGRVVYEYLLDIITNFTAQINSFETVEDLTDKLFKFEEATDKIRFVYRYLERYYIKINIDKREKDIMDIKTMLYTLLYTNYLEKRENHLNDILIEKIDTISIHNTEELEIIKKTIRLYSAILSANDEDKKFKSFIRKYFMFFATRIKDEPKFKTQYDLLHKRVKISVSIFDPYYLTSIQKNFIMIFSKKKDDVLSHIIDQMRMNKRVSFSFLVVETLDLKDKFYSLYEVFVKDFFPNMNKENLESIIDIYLLFRKRIETDFGNDEVMLQILDKYNYEVNINDISMFIIMKLNIYLLSFYNREKIGVLVRYINNLEFNRVIENKLISQMENRLLFHEFDKVLELFVADKIDKNKYSDFCARIKRCLRDIERTRKTFGSGNELILGVEDKNDFITHIEFFILTFGFWELDDLSFKANKTLLNFQHKIQDSLISDFKEKKTEYYYEFSPIEIEFNGCRIKMSTNTYLLFDFINENPHSMTKSINEYFNEDCAYHLNILLENRLIIQEDNFCSVNLLFDQERLNLFEKYLTRTYKIDKESLQNIDPIHSIEAKIMRTLKKRVKCDKNEFFKFIECENSELYRNALDNLLRKEYCKLDDSILYYIP